MDANLTAGLAIIGAFTGLFSLGWQLVSWLRSGPVVRLEAHLTSSVHPRDAEKDQIYLVVTNIGRLATQVQRVGVSDRRQVGRVARSLLRRTVWRVRKPALHRVFTDDREQPYVLKPFWTEKHYVSVDEGWPRYVYPFVMLGDGRVARDRRIAVQGRAIEG